MDLLNNRFRNLEKMDLLHNRFRIVDLLFTK